MHSAGWRWHRIWPCCCFAMFCFPKTSIPCHGSFETRSPRSSWKLFHHCLDKLQLSWQHSEWNILQLFDSLDVLPDMVQARWRVSKPIFGTWLMCLCWSPCYVWCATLALSKSHAGSDTILLTNFRNQIMLIYLPQLDSWHHVSDHAYFHSQDAVPAFILWSQVC